MADWSADAELQNGYHDDSVRSKHSSVSSGSTGMGRHDNDGRHGVILYGGNQLVEESGTELTTFTNG